MKHLMAKDVDTIWVHQMEDATYTPHEKSHTLCFKETETLMVSCYTLEACLVV